MNPLFHYKDVNDEYKNIFQYFEYYNDNTLLVPIYCKDDESIVAELCEFILELCKNDISNAIDKIRVSKLTCLNHMIPLKDISNEIYHLIFGRVNDLLVTKKLIATPYETNKEGRYLKSFKINN